MVYDVYHNRGKLIFTMAQKSGTIKLMTTILLMRSLLVGQVSQKNYLVTVNQEGSTIKTEVYSGDRQPKADIEKQYAWYAYRKILFTSGGYEGKLLNGIYSEFYLNDQLLAKGRFSMGLKNKEWRYWYPEGTLKEVINWRKGVKHGDYALYNDYGRIMASGKFKNNKLHARFYTYNMEGKVISKKRYRKGNEVLEKVKRDLEENNESKSKRQKIETEKRGNGWFKRLFKKKGSRPARTKRSDYESKLS